MYDNFFFSDNGDTTEATLNTPLKEGKGFLYEGGIRIPLIVRWPDRISPGSTCDVPVISDDLYPTIMEMVGKGAKPAGDIDGLSLMPLLFGKGHLKRDRLCWYYPHYSPQAQMPRYAIRKGNFKLIEHYNPIKTDLFDLQSDLSEITNLTDKNSGKVEELRISFNQWLDRMNPVRHTQNPDFREK